MRNRAIIIGSGLGGLGSACLLAKAGWDVTILEKNEQVGGRASVFEAEGFRFDMGPSWYLMPDVFEHFFDLLGERVETHLKLTKLQPSYRVFYKGITKQIDIYSHLAKDLPTIEALEPGAGQEFKKYLDKASYQYEIAKNRFMYKNYDRLGDFFNFEMATIGTKLNVLSKMNNYVGKYFKTIELQKLMQYPLLFLGSSPYNTPAIYSILSHIDFNMGVFYPKGGIYTVAKTLKEVAEKHGVKFRLNSPVRQIMVSSGQAVGVKTDNDELKADMVISNADIYHTEQQLLAPQYRTKSLTYWRKRILAPSALVIYLGVKDRLPSLSHHNLLFSQDWKQDFAEIFDSPKFPTDPSLYICNPSKTDSTVAPKGCENLFVLVPLAAGLTYRDSQLEDYADKVLGIIEHHMGAKNLRKNIIYKRLFSVKEFSERYNSYKGSALGLAHSLGQTAIFRPSNVSKRVKNLYFVGAGTNPGIGMPAALISAELMYKRVIGDHSTGPLSPR